MRAGISTACLYPQETEKALPELIGMGFKLYEVFINTFSELATPYLKELRAMLDDGGCEVRSVHPFTSGFEGFLLFSDYERRFEDGLEFYKSYFEAANLLGARLLVIHGQRAGNVPQAGGEERYFERYARLYALGKQSGITVAQENVDRFRSGDPAFITRMRKSLGDGCAFVLDVKQAVREGHSPFEVCAAMGERLVHVHLNDNSAKTDCLLPGRGGMDFSCLMDQLAGLNYDGDLIVEVYRNSFNGLNELVPAVALTEKLAEKFSARG